MLPVRFWSDSQNVICWLHNTDRQRKMYRVVKVLTRSESNQWGWVPSEDNPADHASRGCRLGELFKTNWVSGPDWLGKSEIDFPTQPTSVTLTDEAKIEDKPIINHALEKAREVE